MLLTLALAALGLSVGASAFPHHKQTIEWKSCPELNQEIAAQIGVPGALFDCATLPVPLDHTDPEGETLNLSLFKINATQEPVLGSVLYNPGGPGGTGGENLPYDGPLLQENMGGQYHMVSFDPRGTGRTIPFNCTPPGSQNLQRRDIDHLLSVNVTERFLNGGWENAVALADACYATQNRTGQFIGTTSVARDMLAIVDALGEDGLLRYYGWSYGSALGEYFAAMFPDRVERMLLDGVVDPNIWRLGHRGNYLVDADAAMRGFINECIKNKDDCALMNATGATTSEELFNVLNYLLEPLAANATSDPEAWTAYYGTKQYVFSQLYWPALWPRLAEFLATTATEVDTTQTPEPSAVAPSYDLGQNALDGIRCSDATFQVASAEDYLPQLAYQSTISSSFSDGGYEALWACAAWKMPNKGRYEGPFTAKTKHPILFVNGEYDVTSPIEGAYNTSKGFEGSVVLPHSGYGHGIIASPSRCVAGYIAAYFVNGTLPGSGVRCEPDLGPWEQARASTE